MAEKDGSKILAIVTICIMLVTIGFGGCIGDDGGNDDSKNNNKIDYATADDLKLILEIDNGSLADNINMTLKLISINKYPVIIDDYLALDHSILDLFLTGPNNETLDIPLGMSDRVINKYTTLKFGEFLELKTSLKYLPIYFKVKNENGTYDKIWDWTIKGIYKIWAIYKINTSEVIYSNVVEFEIENLEPEINKNEYSSPYDFIYIYGSIIYEVIIGEYNSFDGNDPLPDEFYKYNPINKTISLYEEVNKKHISAVLFSQYYLNHANSSVVNVNYEPFRIINNLPYNRDIVACIYLTFSSLFEMEL